MPRSIPQHESFTVEFKSDRRKLPDNDLLEAVVCLANSDGGDLFLGVEDDGRVTGLHADHGQASLLAALIANRTNPPLSVRVSMLHEDGQAVAHIETPRSPRIVATSDGRVYRRSMQGDGKPACVPFYPHEFASREADLGLLDYSALPVAGATLSDIDPMEIHRLRQMVERFHGDRSLLGLADDELLGALNLARRENGDRRPTVAGLLLLGREAALRERLPTHEVAFQVLNATQVLMNDFWRAPLLRVFDDVMSRFAARVVEEELLVGFVRVGIPNFDAHAFREAFVNAVVHRDYARLGTVHARWENDRIVVSNPGGFVAGVTVANILVTEPRPRNPTLADAMKRIGLTERTGRGVDLIYHGLLRYGRPAPDYGRSDRTLVVVDLAGGPADTQLLRLIIAEEERLHGPLPLDLLIALRQLRHERRVRAAALAPAIQRDEGAARAVLERLVESGLAETHGSGAHRAYTLSAALYREAGQSNAYVRQTSFDPLQQEQMVMKLARTDGRITRKQAAELCRLPPQQATRLLRRLVNSGCLRRQGTQRGAYYEPI